MLNFDPEVCFLALTMKLVLDLLDFSAYFLYSIDTGFPLAYQGDIIDAVEIYCL
jgi:hypothetical protein